MVGKKRNLMANDTRKARFPIYKNLLFAINRKISTSESMSFSKFIHKYNFFIDVHIYLICILLTFTVYFLLRLIIAEHVPSYNFLFNCIVFPHTYKFRIYNFFDAVFVGKLLCCRGEKLIFMLQG